MLFFGKNKREDINLIPEDQQTLKVQANTRWLYVFFALLAVLVFGIYGYFFIQERLAISESSRIKSETEQQLSVWANQSSAAAQLKAIHTKLASYKTIASQVDLHKKLTTLADATPGKIQFLSLNLDTKGKVQVQGKASSAASAYQFLNSLNSKPSQFTSVTLTSITKNSEADEVQFTLVLTVN